MKKKFLIWCILIFLIVIPTFIFDRWQLHYSYSEFLHRKLRASHGFFFSWSVMVRNQELVRGWIRSDFTKENAKFVSPGIVVKQARILYGFGTPEDFQLILDRTGLGFTLFPDFAEGEVPDSMRQAANSSLELLILALFEFACKLRGTPEDAWLYLEAELARVGAAPEIMRAFMKQKEGYEKAAHAKQ